MNDDADVQLEAMPKCIVCYILHLCHSPGWPYIIMLKVGIIKEQGKKSSLK